MTKEQLKEKRKYKDGVGFYRCQYCWDEWKFIPEDFDYEVKYYPTTCPFCEMTKIQLFKDVYKMEGFISAIIEVVKRIRVKHRKIKVVSYYNADGSI